MRALRMQRPRDRLADTTACTGNEGSFAREIEH
jgi:hypothetical protein